MLHYVTCVMLYYIIAYLCIYMLYYYISMVSRPPKDVCLRSRFSCFLHFLLGQLHLECRWPTVRQEDSVMMRIFGGLIRCRETAPFLLLHLDLTESGRTSVHETISALDGMREEMEDRMNAMENDMKIQKQR